MRNTIGSGPYKATDMRIALGGIYQDSIFGFRQRQWQ